MDGAVPRNEPVPSVGDATGKVPAPPTAPWRAYSWRALKVGVLAVVLTVHFLSRQHLVSTRFVQDGWNYPYVYRTSLALLAGHGFQVYRLSDAPESRPVVEFLNGHCDELTEPDFRRFLDGPDAHPVAFPLPEAQPGLPQYPPEGELKTPLDPLHTIRVLDLYTTAFLWRVFGIRWSVLQTFCAVLSTAVGLLIFFMARRLGGGFWPGLCAAVLFLASPLENDFAIRNLRDISPLWFAALAFAAFVCLVERWRSAPANWAALGLTGFACTLGCGWRPDAMTLAPFVAASAAVLLLVRRKGWRYLLAGGLAFLVGAAAPVAAIRLMCRVPGRSPLVGFHISYYGEFARCNLLGLENTFEVSRDDIETALTAQQYHADHDGGGPVPCYGPAYGASCFAMYREEGFPNLYHWTAGFPGFYIRALDACRDRDLPINATMLLPPLDRPDWLKSPAAWLLEPLSWAGPWLFALGAVVGLVRPGERWRCFCLLTFSVFYAGVLFFVLPELKHAGPLVLPLSVFGGIGLAVVGRGAWGVARERPSVRLLASRFTPHAPRLLWLAAGAVAATLVWGLACAGAYAYSVECRRELLAAVTKLTADGRPAPEALRAAQLFSVTLLPERGDGPAGYLLRIDAGPGGTGGATPPLLECRRLHHDHPLAPARLLFTRHRLHPGREQFFFVTCQPGTAFGDPRPFVCTALLDGDARFLSCTRVDLSDWRRLPVGTVFVPGASEPGDPVVGGTTGLTRYTENPDLNTLGLSFADLLRCGGAVPAAVFPAGDGQSADRRADLPPESWKPVAPVCPTELGADGLRVWASAPTGAYAVETPTITAPADGTYFFRLRYRPESGRLTLGVLPADRQSWLALLPCDDPAGADAEHVVKVKLHEGQVFSVVTINGSAREGERSVFVIRGLSAWRDATEEKAE